MLRRLTALGLVIAALTAIASSAPASAFLVTHPRCHLLRCVAASQHANLAHARYVCRHGRHANKAWSCSATKWLEREYAQTEKWMHPVHPKATAAGHWAGWSCITNGAYPGAAHEGNGYNGSWVGPLGMTTPWAGYRPTGRDWVHTPVAIVYGYAEKEASRHGFSDAWMRGQWPNTYPPCYHFFH